MKSYIWLFYIICLSLTVQSKIINFETDCGAIPDDSSLATVLKNGGLINTTFSQLQPGDVFFFPNKTFYIMGGLIAQNLQSVTFQFDGTLIYSDDKTNWPHNEKGDPLECMLFQNVTNVTWTSSGIGLIDGQGAKWWDGTGGRPRIMNIGQSSQLLVENLLLKDSPFWTFWANGVDGLEIRNCEVSARRTNADKHTILDLTARNTDGFDMTNSTNVWIHDCAVWNQDDCYVVKDGSQNILVERVNASGFGLSIGSISGSTVRNVTFRDAYMHNSYRGLYMKFRSGDQPGLVEDVLYENIYMENTEQWPVWIGPYQEGTCAPDPCSLCWPVDPLAKCNMPAAGTYKNITIRNVTISNPPKKVGMIMANATNPMSNIVLDGVTVINYDQSAANDYAYYTCENVINGTATGNTWPVPSCLQNNTISSEMMDLISF